DPAVAGQDIVDDPKVNIAVVEDGIAKLKGQRKNYPQECDEGKSIYRLKPCSLSRSDSRFWHPDNNSTRGGGSSADQDKSAWNSGIINPNIQDLEMRMLSA